MSLKIESLYCFSVIAEADNFSQAAERLFITQQALSKILSQLEQELGQPLIYRNQRGRQRLTPAGELLHKNCFTLLGSVYALENLFTHEEAVATTTAHIRLSANFALEKEIAGLLQKWGEQDNPIAPSFFLSHSTAKIEQDLLNDTLDLGILCQPPLSSHLTAVRIKSSPYVIVGASHIEGRWDELSYLSFVTQPDQGGVLNVWPEERWPRCILGEADMNMAMQLCSTGVACLHLPESFYPFRSPSMPATAMHIVTEAPFEAFYNRYLVWPAHKSQSSHVEALKQEILRVMGVA